MRTAQEIALNAVREAYGRIAFTEDHINYRRVGFRVGGRTFAAIGDTWEQAIEKVKESQ